MKNIYQYIAVNIHDPGSICVATLVYKSGSAPQTPGNSALFSDKALLQGTLGGGVLEYETAQKAAAAIHDKKSSCFLYDLDEDIGNPKGAICGGKAGILLDADPGKHTDTFHKLNEALLERIPGFLLTSFRTGPDGVTDIERHWLPDGERMPLPVPFGKISRENLDKCFRERQAVLLTGYTASTQFPLESGVFIEPVIPYPRLIISGAGHIGKALTHLGALLDFDITVIDDRPELCNAVNLPEAGEILTGDIGHLMEHIHFTSDSYVVIVTHGHAADAEALKACIGSDAAYIGMIGSFRKTQLMRREFLEKNWATPLQWNRIHAPVGLDIGSKTVQEIALSIAAEMVRERNKHSTPDDGKKISGLVLAAGESKRMGTPKMLLAYDESTIIETVVRRIMESDIRDIHVVIGAEKERMTKKLSAYNVHLIVNGDFREGMYSSVRCGFNALPGDTDAVMVFLGDQPMIKIEVIHELIKAWKKPEKELSFLYTRTEGVIRC